MREPKKAARSCSTRLVPAPSKHQIPRPVDRAALPVTQSTTQNPKTHPHTTPSAGPPCRPLLPPPGSDSFGLVSTPPPPAASPPAATAPAASPAAAPLLPLLPVLTQPQQRRGRRRRLEHGPPGGGRHHHVDQQRAQDTQADAQLVQGTQGAADARGRHLGLEAQAGRDTTRLNTVFSRGGRAPRSPLFSSVNRGVRLPLLTITATWISSTTEFA